MFAIELWTELRCNIISSSDITPNEKNERSGLKIKAPYLMDSNVLGNTAGGACASTHCAEVSTPEMPSIVD
jgi:hypothetical protein